MEASAARNDVPARAFTLEPYAYAAVRELTRELGISEPVAITLVRRGHRTVDEARAFLEADESHDPLGFADMAAAVERISGSDRGAPARHRAR